MKTLTWRTLINASKSTSCRHNLKIKQLHAVIYIVLYRSSNSVWKLNQTCHVITVRKFVHWKALNISLQSSYSFYARYRCFLTIFYSVKDANWEVEVISLRDRCSMFLKPGYKKMKHLEILLRDWYENQRHAKRLKRGVLF